MIKKVLGYLINLWYTLTRIRLKGRGLDMAKKFSALDIAYWFIWKNKFEKSENETEYDDHYEVYEGLSHLKLQKLLYYAQGISLAYDGELLFNDKILAWEHGPVIKKVYEYFRVFGRGDIEVKFDCKKLDVIKSIEENPEVLTILNMTYSNFSIYTAWQLRQMSHVHNGPWETTVRTKGLNKEISKELIKRYFEENIVENA